MDSRNTAISVSSNATGIKPCGTGDAMYGAGPVVPASNSGWLNMQQAAGHMGYSYFWLAHNWKRLGIRPTFFGRRRMFQLSELDEWMSRQRFRSRGRSPA